MIRFCDKEIVCVMQDELERGELLSYFLRGHRNESVIVLDENGQYVGRITYPQLLKNERVEQAIDKNYVLMDEQIFDKGRQFFKQYTTVFGECPILPVLTLDKQLLCFAYEEEESNREIRMLRELEATEDAIGFEQLYSEYDCVTINGFNELAYYFVMYLQKRGILVNVTGDLWSQLGEWEMQPALEYRNFQIYAEGVNQLEEDLRYRQLRSVSPEFECIDVIYEENLNQGIIQDTKGDWNSLLNTLRNEKEIVIIGTGQESQDTYDLLLANGVECCCFTSKARNVQQKMFGKDIVNERELMNCFKNPIFIECTSEHSSWGLSDVDYFDYYGFHRNENFIVIKDYIDIYQTNLLHVLEGKKIALLGDVYLCNKFYHYFQKTHEVLGYLNIDKVEQIHSFAMQECEWEQVTEDVFVLVILSPYYGCLAVSMKTYWEKIVYFFKEKEFFNYSFYFSNKESLIKFMIDEKKYTKKKLCPKGIILGNSSGASGNVFIRDVFWAHPNIISMNLEYFESNMLIVCIQLSELSVKEIPHHFMKLWEKIDEEYNKYDLYKRKIFREELEKLLNGIENITPQELFVGVQIAYAKMHGKNVYDINSTYIFWDVHAVSAEISTKVTEWFEDELINTYILRLTRNRCVATGSYARYMDTEEGNVECFSNYIYYPFEDDEIEKNGWKRFVVRFEDLKCEPAKTYKEICKKLGIPWNDKWLANVRCNDFSSMAKLFDLKPVYNYNEEYFSEYDRMKISLLQSPYQSIHGYPFICISDFTRRQLQEMFIKDWHIEKKIISNYSQEMKMDYYKNKQQSIVKRLWKLRQIERVKRLEDTQK